MIVDRKCGHEKVYTHSSHSLASSFLYEYSIVVLITTCSPDVFNEIEPNTVLPNHAPAYRGVLSPSFVSPYCFVKLEAMYLSHHVMYV